MAQCDRITADEMQLFASRLLKKPSCDVTIREAIAALPALRLYRNGASALAVFNCYKKTFEEIVE
jgi:hypothetical protein